MGNMQARAVNMPCGRMCRKLEKGGKGNRGLIKYMLQSLSFIRYLYANVKDSCIFKRHCLLSAVLNERFNAHVIRKVGDRPPNECSTKAAYRQSQQKIPHF